MRAMMALESSRAEALGGVSVCCSRPLWRLARKPMGGDQDNAHANGPPGWHAECGRQRRLSGAWAAQHGRGGQQTCAQYNRRQPVFQKESAAAVATAALSSRWLCHLYRSLCTCFLSMMPQFGAGASPSM